MLPQKGTYLYFLLFLDTKNNNMANQTLKYAYYTVKEAAEITTYNYKYLLRLINEGKLPATKPSGGKWVIKAEDLKDFMEGKL